MSSCTEEHKYENNSLETTEKAPEVQEELINHPDDFVTTNGINVKFPITDSTYNLSWQRFASYDTLNLTLPLILGGHVSFPSLIDENENYLYFGNGCGSPCWNGFFLPLNGNRMAQEVQYPIAYDLDRHTVASIADMNQIELLNLKTGAKKMIETESCYSAFTGYCIDSAYFDDNTFYYSWDKDASMNKGNTNFIAVKVDWY